MGARTVHRVTAVIAYTDGGCRGNPGIGSWAYLLINAQNGQALARADGEADTTNNRMELSAVLFALRALKNEGTEIEIRSDSTYTIDCCTKWMPGWKSRGWTRKGGPIKNLDLITALDDELVKHVVSFTWVKGHSGDRGNDFVDELLNERMDGLASGGGTAIERKLQWQLG